MPGSTPSRTIAPSSIGRASVILVVEDDAPFARILHDLAHELDFDCLVATTADEGLELARALPPERHRARRRAARPLRPRVLERLKHDPATRHIPVHVVSVDDYSADGAGAGRGRLRAQARQARASSSRRSASSRRSFTQRVRRSWSSRTTRAAREHPRPARRRRRRDRRRRHGAARRWSSSRATTFDCMVLDLALPDATGFELLEKMARDERYAFPPVIVYTGRALSRDEEQRLRRYSSSIIIKGARSPERLLDEVTLFLHQVEARAAARAAAHARASARPRGRLRGPARSSSSRTTCATSSRSRASSSRGAPASRSRATAARRSTQLERMPDVDLVLMDVMMPEMDGLDGDARDPRERRACASSRSSRSPPRRWRDDQEQCLAAGRERLHRQAARRRQAALARARVDARSRRARDARRRSSSRLLLEAIFERVPLRLPRATRPLRCAAASRRALGALRAALDLARSRSASSATTAVFRELLRYLTVQVSDLFRDPAYFRALPRGGRPPPRTYPSLEGLGRRLRPPARRSTRSRSCSPRRACSSGPSSTRPTSTPRPPDGRGRDLRRSSAIRALQPRTTSAAGGQRLARRLLHGRLRRRGVRSQRCGSAIVFADHSLATDSVFAEVQLVSCRNVLIYFDRALQDRALGLFRDVALPHAAFSASGPRRPSRFSPNAHAFVDAVHDERIYQNARRGGTWTTGPGSSTWSWWVPPPARSRRSARILPALPRSFPLPIVVVAPPASRAAERPRASSSDRGARSVSSRPRTRSRSPPAAVTFAPPDYHLLIERERTLRALASTSRCTSRGPRSTCSSSPRPTPTGRGRCGVLLTGANDDGARGLERIGRGRRHRRRPGARRARGRRRCPRPRSRLRPAAALRPRSARDRGARWRRSIERRRP